MRRICGFGLNSQWLCCRRKWLPEFASKRKRAGAGNCTCPSLPRPSCYLIFQSRQPWCSAVEISLLAGSTNAVCWWRACEASCGWRCWMALSPGAYSHRFWELLRQFLSYHCLAEDAYLEGFLWSTHLSLLFSFACFGSIFIWSQSVCFSTLLAPYWTLVTFSKRSFLTSASPKLLNPSFSQIIQINSLPC